VIAPISLGWHFKRADATAGYTIFVPTGRYTDLEIRLAERPNDSAEPLRSTLTTCSEPLTH